MKKTLKRLTRKVHRRFGYDVVISGSWISREKIPNATRKQADLLKNFESPVIFDIGAHIGEAALKYAELLPNATIYSFEPYPDSYKKLKANTKAFKNIIPVDIALGNEEKSNKLKVNKFAATNSFLATHNQGKEIWGDNILDTEKEVEVEVTTVDTYLERNHISRIHLLKTDTQGFEYQVLKGAEGAMKNHHIDYVYMEIITLPTYENQKSLEFYLRYMRQLNYSLFNFYDLSYKNDGKLRQVDALFYRDGLFQNN